MWSAHSWCQWHKYGRRETYQWPNYITLLTEKVREKKHREKKKKGTELGEVDGIQFSLGQKPPTTILHYKSTVHFSLFHLIYIESAAMSGTSSPLVGKTSKFKTSYYEVLSTKYYKYDSPGWDFRRLLNRQCHRRIFSGCLSLQAEIHNWKISFRSAKVEADCCDAKGLCGIASDVKKYGDIIEELDSCGHVQAELDIYGLRWG